MDDLERRFQKAYQIASAMTEKLPPDVMLRFYAYYKHGNSGNKMVRPSGNNPIRNAFKLNAWFQINSMSRERAKKEYIKLVETYTNQKIK